LRRLLLIGSLFLLPAVSPAALLNFEGLTTGTFLTDEFQASDSIVFLENARVHFLGANHATSGLSGLFNGGASIRAEFRLPDGSPAVTNMVSIKGDLIPIAGTVTLEAFDSNGSLVGSDVKPDSPAPASLSLSASGIHSIRFFSQSGTVAFDDLAFNTPVAVDATIPEPGSLALFLSGFVGLFAFRRRK